MNIITSEPKILEYENESKCQCGSGTIKTKSVFYCRHITTDEDEIGRRSRICSSAQFRYAEVNGLKIYSCALCGSVYTE